MTTGNPVEPHSEVGMRKGILVCAFALLAAASRTVAQPPPSPTPAVITSPYLELAGGKATQLVSAVPVAAVERPAAPTPARLDTEAGTALAEEPFAPGRWWARAELLTWWIKGGATPPLVTTSSPAQAGILGPGTSVLFGGSTLDAESFLGGRFALGAWLNDCQTFGLEGEFFFLGQRSVNFIAGNQGGPGSPVVARPFFNALTGMEDAQLVAFPGVLAGSVRVTNPTSLLGAGANGVCNLCCRECCCTGYRVDALAGFRYLRLADDLHIDENLTELAGGPVPGTGFVVSDQFDTRSEFYGGQLGLRGEYHRGRAFVNLTGLLGLGLSHETLKTRGSTTITLPGAAPLVQPGGLLALPTNSGNFSQDEFAVVPELRVNVGYQLTPHARAYAGYTFLYWSEVLRPGDQIDRVINPSQVPSTLGAGALTGPARPAVLLKSTDFWAQGINLGLEFRF
jgi:hypothetical protein